MVFAVTAAGPILGWLGWSIHADWLYVVGVAICALTLFLDVASGALKTPILPVVFMIVGIQWHDGGWIAGAMRGLLTWTTFEAIGYMFAGRRSY